MAAPWQVSGTTDIAPHSPVADWRCVAEGEGYGNYYDPISQQYATVTRATPKTARTADGRIVDVPAGKLALEPWSLHKEGGVGHAAIIEEARTNYLTNSYGAENDGYRWTLASGWGFVGLRMDLFSRAIVPGVYGTTAQRLFVENVVSSGFTYMNLTAVHDTPFVAGESAYGTAWVKAFVLSGCAGTYNLVAKNTAGVQLGTVSTSIAVNDEFVRIGKAYIGLPVGTAKLHPNVSVTGLSDGASFDITIDAVQLEKGSFATSYIPTTTAAVTRNTDVVTVPTTGWSAATLTYCAVAAKQAVGYPRTLVNWNGSSDTNRISIYTAAATYMFVGASGSNWVSSPLVQSAAVIGGTWDSASIKAYLDGSPSAATAFTSTPVELKSTASIGTNYGLQAWGGPIARLTVYDKALTDEQLAAADMTTDLLAGIEGVAAPALAADWRVVPTGLGYGNYYDSVTQQWATVTRTTPKTAQIAPDRIVDVPAGQLAVVPWSLHKAGGTGYAAVIEEARTNYLLNSYGAANDGRLWSSWTSAGSLFYVLDQEIVDGLYGPSAQRLKHESPPEGDTLFGNFSQVSGVGSFLAGEKAISSFYMRGDTENAKIEVQTASFAADGVTLLGYVVANVTLTSDWQRFMMAYSELPANTSRARALVSYFPSKGGSGYYSFDITIDAAQLEKGSFATSYIPTTTAAATRNADVVTVPTAGWSKDAATYVAVVRPDGNNSNNYALYIPPTSSLVNRVTIQTLPGANVVGTAYGADGSAKQAFIASAARAAKVVAFTIGSNLTIYVDGTASTPVASDAANGMSTTANIGSVGGVGSVASPIARVIVYATALTDAQIQSAELTTELLKGLDTARVTLQEVIH